MYEVKQFANDRVWYVPDIEVVIDDPVPDDPGRVTLWKNRLDPEPFAVLIEPMSGYEFKALMQRAGVVSRAAEQNPVQRSHDIRDDVIRHRVIEVTGYSVERRDRSGVITPTNGKELLDAVYEAGGTDPETILNDIQRALENHSALRLGLLERLNSRRESQSVGAASPLSGDVADAVEKTEPEQT